MKYFNDFNDMYNSNKQSDSMSVFNEVKEVNRPFEIGNGTYGVYEIDIDGAYLGCVYYKTDEEVGKANLLRDKVSIGEDEGTYDYLHRLTDLPMEEDPTAVVFGFWFDDYNSWGIYNNTIEEKYGADVFDKLYYPVMEVIEDSIGFADYFDGNGVVSEVPLTKSEAKGVAENIYKAAKSVLG